MMGLSSQNAPALDLPARFMVLGIISFMTAMVISPVALPMLQDGFSDFSLLAYVHLLTLGFIGSMLFGASYQLVPVAVGERLSSTRFGRISFWFFLPGLFLFLVSLLASWLPGLAIGGTLLGIAFVIYIGVIGLTVLRAPNKDTVAWHILVGLLMSGTGMSLGVLLAFNKSSGVLGSRLLDILAAHIVVMLAGWVGITLTGVAYRLIGMFTLAEKHLIHWLAWTELALVTTGTTLFALRFVFDLPSVVGQVAAGLVLAGFVGFAVQMRRLYQRRMRRAFDIHMPFAIFAGGVAIVASASLTLGLVVHLSPNEPIWMATGFLAILGVAGTAIQGFFYKISTFLVWLKRYSPVAGRQPVPKLEELYSKQVAVAGFWTWSAGIVLGWLFLLLDLPALPLVGLVLIAGVGCFVFNVINIGRHWISGSSWSPFGDLIARSRIHRPLEG